jgi:hypothetical protein
MKTSAAYALLILVGGLGLPDTLSATSITFGTASVTFSTLQPLGRTHGINKNKQIVGHSVGREHAKGFIYENGNTTVFSVPGSAQTLVYGVENTGRVVGAYNVFASGTHGYIYFHGDVTTLDYPGAKWTVARGINDPQRVVGYFEDGTGVHGFFFDNKDYTKIDVPSAVNTYAIGLNNAGDIVGYYTLGTGDDSHQYGFLLDKNGKYTTVDVPGATDTFLFGINSAGVIVGSYIDADTGGTHGFVNVGGVFATFDAPATPPGGGTIAEAINDNGDILVYGITAVLGTLVP